MTAVARTERKKAVPGARPRASAPRRAAPPEVRAALDDVAQALVTRLAHLFSTLESPSAHKSARKALEEALQSQLPAFLADEFAGHLLAPDSVRNAAKVRGQRQLLVHLLSGVDVPAIVSAEKHRGTSSAGHAARRSRITSWPDTDGADDAAADVVASDEGGRMLTTKGAAKLLHMSRTHVIGLADAGLLGQVSKTAGGHRRIPEEAALAYKKQMKARQAKGLEAMVAATQRSGLYDRELEGIARPPKRR